MHRESIGAATGLRRGMCSKQFVADLRSQGVSRDEAIQAVSQAFGVSWSAAQLFVGSHPAWGEDERERDSWPWWPASSG